MKHTPEQVDAVGGGARGRGGRGGFTLIELLVVIAAVEHDIPEIPDPCRLCADKGRSPLASVASVLQGSPRRGYRECHHERGFICGPRGNTDAALGTNVNPYGAPVPIIQADCEHWRDWLTRRGRSVNTDRDALLLCRSTTGIFRYGTPLTEDC